MGPGIVLLEDKVARLHTWDGNWAEDFVSIHVHYSKPSNKIFVAYIMYPVSVSSEYTSIRKKNPTLREFLNDVKKSKCSYNLNLCDICPGI